MMTESSRRLFVSSNGGIQISLSPTLDPDRSAHASGSGDLAKGPMLVYWEMTQACALACRHCRAEAVCLPHPGELKLAEGKDLLRQIAAFGKPLPHLILTGGDPLKRPDLYELIDEAQSLGLMVSVTPSVTPELNFDVLSKLKAHGIESLGLSLDGSNAARHDAVRGIEGCFDRTILTAKSAGELAIPIQVNTLVSEETADDLPAIYELLKSCKVMRWSLFFLIAVGRGKVLQPVSPERGEELMHWIYDLSRVAPFAIKTTEAPSYRRVALNRMREEGMLSAEIQRTPVYRGFGIRDGHGIMFVSHQGDIYPAGFLPLTVATCAYTILWMSTAVRRYFGRCAPQANSRANAGNASIAHCAAAPAHAPLPILATRWRATHSVLTNPGPMLPSAIPCGVLSWDEGSSEVSLCRVRVNFPFRSIFPVFEEERSNRENLDANPCRVARHRCHSAQRSEGRLSGNDDSSCGGNRRKNAEHGCRLWIFVQTEGQSGMPRAPKQTMQSGEYKDKTNLQRIWLDQPENQPADK